MTLENNQKYLKKYIKKVISSNKIYLKWIVYFNQKCVTGYIWHEDSQTYKIKLELSNLIKKQYNFDISTYDLIDILLDVKDEILNEMVEKYRHKLCAPPMISFED